MENELLMSRCEDDKIQEYVIEKTQAVEINFSVTKSN